MKPHQDTKTPANATPNPGARRRARRSPPGGLDALRRELWHALRRIGDTLDHPDPDPGDLCRAGNTLAALANAYRAVTAEHDFERELADIRRELHEATAALGRAASRSASARAADAN